MNKIPRNLKLKERAKNLRKAGYLHEVMLWKRIKGKQISGLTFHRQQIIGNFIVDFFAPSIRVAIELDGSSHNTKVEYDKARDNFLKSLGINVIHIPVKDIFNNIDEVVNAIYRICENSCLIYPVKPQGLATPL